jgi:hypothetical protein
LRHREREACRAASPQILGKFRSEEPRKSEIVRDRSGPFRTIPDNDRRACALAWQQVATGVAVRGAYTRIGEVAMTRSQLWRRNITLRRLRGGTRRRDGAAAALQAAAESSC